MKVQMTLGISRMIQSAFFLLFLSFQSNAGIPVWTFTPLTPTNITVSINSSAIIQYRVTNQSRLTHHLTMHPIPGISQITSEGFCASPFTLTAHQSCILNLLVDGSLLSHNINEGPIVCDTPLECYQPGRQNSLNITLTTNPQQYTIGGTVTNLRETLVIDNNGTDELTINSDGSYVFSTPLSEGQTYDVNVVSQPSGQTCEVSNSTGTVETSDVTNVDINCATHWAYVVNYGTHLVSFCPMADDGSFEFCEDAGREIVTPFEAIEGIAINPQGTHAYITDLSNVVYLCYINNRGRFDECLDALGMQDVFVGDLTFDAPYGIALYDNYAYVVNSGNNSVSVCTIENDGKFSSCSDAGGTGAEFNSPRFIAIDSSSGTAYITNGSFYSPSLSICPINLLGTFDECTNQPLPFENPEGIALNPSRTKAYITNTTDVYACDIIQPLISSYSDIIGSCQNVGYTPTPFNGPFDITINRSGSMAYITNPGSDPGTVTQCPIQSDGTFASCQNTGGDFSGPQGIALFEQVIIH